MKFHWGHGITAAALLFICFICALVYRSMQEKVDFVTTGYYEKELVYQHHIDSEANALALAVNLKVDLHSKSGQVQVTYPGEFAWENISGEILFYRPDNSELDFTIPVTVDENHFQTVSTTTLKKGAWKVMVHWKNGSTPYYFEKRIFVN